jgi:BlaI family transcriptional regulator, penicillinase repressor
MARPASRYPTELELTILKVLWRQSPLLARDVQNALAEDGRELAKTTVITTLNTMVDKGYLRRKKRSNSFLFSPRVDAATVSKRVLTDVVDRVFDGSTSAVLLKLFDVRDIDSGELKELRRMIDQKLKDAQPVDGAGKAREP